LTDRFLAECDFEITAREMKVVDHRPQALAGSAFELACRELGGSLIDDLPRGEDDIAIQNTLAGGDEIGV
jgi:hypothetical protein